ncbi:FAD-dependent oxidoreductase [Pseudooceanicola sp. CBS1P-1]|uniref:FAD-dependent oxidoreductase n=1 Tax=Pseudooceanicola albus TaxID=2692189 RepID=A0A6L7G5N6_9RHOB|nr:MULTISPECIES: FAD-dependent oxidoreductase [Pseudooceanicola]MBT9385425.1 FAD-dependent oxidoreductase [Pseudooceanicola endophyticus]MXN18716.1 FAD-dependent oxidoreductase [Pseudooceanicola albus]
MNDLSTEADVIILGSGVAGMTCALAAAKDGLRVIVLEKSRLIGGTSAMSGAGVWVPANHVAAREGITDAPETAMTYFRNALGPDSANRFTAHWQAMCDHGGAMLKMVEDETALTFACTPEPDPVDVPGALPRGRMVSPLALARHHAGPFAKKMRRSTLPHLFTYHDMFSPNPWGRPFHTLRKMGFTLLKRWATNTGGQGSALMAGIIGGALKHGAEIRLDTRVAALDIDAGRVCGVQLSDGSRIRARRGVVLATGGFEWNRALYAQHFPGKTDWLCTPDTNSGDAVSLALSAGAALDQMGEANVHPALPTRYEGRAHGMPVAWHVGPHGIIVNAQAKRFVSEYDYNLGEALNAKGPDGQPLNLPAWLICDRRFLFRSLPFSWYALRARNWIRRAPTIEALAQKIGLDPQALAAQVATYNGYCAQNHDPEFQRGEPMWERFRSGNWAPGSRNAALGRIEAGPFLAMPVNRSILGTKGGPRTDEHGRVLDPADRAIPGLYAAGNAMANPIGTRSVGAGTTVGPHMIMGYLCARDLLAGGAPSTQTLGKAASR